MVIHIKFILDRRNLLYGEKAAYFIRSKHMKYQIEKRRGEVCVREKMRREKERRQGHQGPRKSSHDINTTLFNS